MSAVLVYQLLMCATVTAVELFLLESNDLISFENIVTLYILATHLTLSCIYCHLSELVTMDLLRIGDVFFDFAWYEIPVKYQKLFILPIQRSHIEFRFNGLGLIDCTLQNFLLVYTFDDPFDVFDVLIEIHVILFYNCR